VTHQRDGEPGVAHARRRTRGLRVAVPLILVFTGVLFAVSASSSQGYDLRPSGSTDLADLIRSQSRDAEGSTARLDALRSEVDRLAAEGAADPELEQRVQNLNTNVGLTAQDGPGLTVELDDARLPPDGEPISGSPDDYVIHQQDVEGVMNALWRGGAEAMSVMDQRIISTSAVRCVGNVLILNGQVFSPPYRITAIGDLDDLGAALEDEPSVQYYRQFVDQIGLGYDVTRHRQTTVPAYTGSTDLRFVEEQTG